MKYNQKVRSSRKIPELRSGDVVRVHRKVKEGEKERTQIFEGIIIAIKGKQNSSPMITVRKVSFGVGIEITVPVFSPMIEKIEIVKKAKTRRSKLYYLRRKDFKLSKLKTKELGKFVAEEPIEEIIKEKAKEPAVGQKKEEKAEKENFEKREDKE